MNFAKITLIAVVVDMAAIAIIYYMIKWLW